MYYNELFWLSVQAICELWTLEAQEWTGQAREKCR